MKRGVQIALSCIVWIGIIFYLFWAGRLGELKRAETYVSQLEVTVRDSAEIAIIRGEDVRRWIKSAGLDPTGKQIDSVELLAITRMVASHDFVRDVKTSVGLNGAVSVSIKQRQPILRVITESGYDFYYTADEYIVPAGKRSAHYVPVITGRFGLPFDRYFSGRPEEQSEKIEKKSDENYIFLYKLINFVKYIEDSDFWNAQIVQINVLGGSDGVYNKYREPEIELIPRVGDHVVLLGWIDGYEEKLDKLMAFYRKALSHEGWDKWNYINLKFDNQVVCSNKQL